MADGIDALFAALDGGGGDGSITQLAQKVTRGATGIDGAHGVLSPDPARELSAMLGTRAHGGGSHLGVAARGALASRRRYMAATSTQTARALIAALTRAGG